MNRKTIVSLFGLAAFAAVLPTAASARSSVSISIGTGGYYSGYGDNQYGYQGYDPYRGNDRNYRHQRQHGELEDEHGDSHDDLDEQHEEAHEQGLSRREHRYLHRDLRNEHEYRDGQISREHRSEHWQNRYRDYRRNPYFGY